MRVLLINPNRIQPPIAPVALDYLSDSLLAAKHEPVLLDLCFEPDPHHALASALRNWEPDLIGITIRNTDDCYFSSRRFFLPEVRDLIVAIRRFSKAPVVLGGVGYSIAPGAILEFCDADYGIVGDGEVALVELVRALDGRHEARTVPGLCYTTAGQTHLNPPRMLDLGTLPPRRRAFVNNRRYFQEGGQAGFETKRGCSMNCSYCADPVAKGRTIRVVPPAGVVYELQALVDQGIDCFHTCDSEFNLPAWHALAVCEEMIRVGLGKRIRWYTYCSPVPFTSDMAKAFKDAGCAGINFGIDSGSDVMLARLGRSFTRADIERTASICRDHSIPFMFDLLIGAPGETTHTVAETIDLMRRLNPDCVGISLGVRIYPGTKLANELAATKDRGLDLDGAVQANEEKLIEPVFYISPALGAEARSILAHLVEDDPRFFLPEPVGVSPGYNYNDNQPLVNAIRNGARGAYWDILRQLRDRQFTPAPNPGSMS